VGPTLGVPGQDFAISSEAVLRARPTLRALSWTKKGEMKRHVLKHNSPRIRGWISVNSILSIAIGRMQRTPAMRLPMSLAGQAFSIFASFVKPSTTCHDDHGLAPSFVLAAASSPLSSAAYHGINGAAPPRPK
jgi:hypothetical protein